MWFLPTAIAHVAAHKDLSSTACSCPMSHELTKYCAQNVDLFCRSGHSTSQDRRIGRQYRTEHQSIAN